MILILINQSSVFCSSDLKIIGVSKLNKSEYRKNTPFSRHVVVRTTDSRLDYLLQALKLQTGPLGYTVTHTSVRCHCGPSSWSSRLRETVGPWSAPWCCHGAEAAVWLEWFNWCQIYRYPVPPGASKTAADWAMELLNEAAGLRGSQLDNQRDSPSGRTSLGGTI